MHKDVPVHLPNPGFELIARFDQAGIETLSKYADSVEVTVELAK